MIVSTSIRGSDVVDMSIRCYPKSADYCVTLDCLALWFNDRTALEAFTRTLAEYIESLPEQP